VEVEEQQALSDEAWMAMVEVRVLPEHHKNHRLPRTYYCIEMPLLLLALVDTLAVVVVVELEVEVVEGEEWTSPQEEVVVLEVEVEEKRIAVATRGEERMLAALVGPSCMDCLTLLLVA